MVQILNNPKWFWNTILTEASPHWPVICVDFNGVLDQYKGYNGTVEYTEPAAGVEEFLRYLAVAFNTVVIFTATIPIEGVLEWLEKYDLAQYVTFISNWKVPAAVYVDDRAITHRGNFTETLKEIESFAPWWME